MASKPHDPDNSAPIRETYEEFELGETTVGMIADPRETDAWIQSDTVTRVVP